MAFRLRRLPLGVTIAVSLMVGTSLPAAAAEVDIEMTIEVNGGREVPGGSDVLVIATGVDDTEMYCQDDGFDDALTLYFEQEEGNEAYAAPGGMGDRTETPQGTRITAGAVTAASGIEVSMDLLVFGDLAGPGRALFRQTYVLTNPGDSEVTDTFEVGTNYGSDSNTTVDASSSGGEVVDDTGWVVTSDGNARTSSTADPVNLTVYQGPQPTPATPTLVTSPGVPVGDTNGEWEVALSVTVPAGETRYLVFFAASYDWCDAEEFTEAVAAATTDAGAFSSFDLAQSVGLFAGIPEADLPLIANWSATPGPGPDPGPDPGPGPDPAPSPDPSPVAPRFTG